MNLYIPLAARRRRKGAGGGGLPPGPLEVVRSDLDWMTGTFTITGGVAPYEIEAFGVPWTPVVGNTADITFTFFDFQTVRVRDAAATVVELETLICPPPPTTWVPVSVGALPAVNGAERVIAFRDTNRGALAGLQIVNTTTGAPEVIQAFNEDGTPQLQNSAVRAHFARVAPGAVRRVYFARFTSRNVFGYEVTSPASFPIAGVEPKEQLILPLPPGTNMRGLIDDLPHLPTLEFLNNTMGKSNQAAAPWPLNSSIDTVTNVPSGAALSEAHWSGVDWRDGRAPTPTLDDQVAAILFGTQGYVLDPQDASTLFQDIAGTVPITTVGQTVARINGKWGVGGGASWSNNGAAARPAWAGSTLQFDGVDDALNGAGTDFARNAPGAAHVIRAWMDDNGSSKHIVHHSTPTASQTRFGVQVNSARQIVLSVRRPDATGYSPAFSSPIVPLEEAVTVSTVVDAANSSIAEGFVNGVASGPVAIGGAEPFSDTAGTTFRMGRALGAGTIYFSGLMGRQVFCPFAPTPEQRAVLEAWVSSGPFDPPPPPPPAADQWTLPEDFSTLPPEGGVVAHNGQDWRNISLIPNLWEPGIFGWEIDP